MSRPPHQHIILHFMICHSEKCHRPPHLKLSQRTARWNRKRVVSTVGPLPTLLASLLLGERRDHLCGLHTRRSLLRRARADPVTSLLLKSESPVRKVSTTFGRVHGNYRRFYTRQLSFRNNKFRLRQQSVVLGNVQEWPAKI